MMTTKYPFLFCLALASFLSVPFGGALRAAQNNSKTEKVEAARKEMDKLKEVLSYGHAEQVVLALKRVAKLKDSQQKELLPQLKGLLTNRDWEVQKGLVELVQKLKWSDLDKEVLVFFDSASTPVIITLLSHCRQKKIAEVLPRVRDFLKEIDYKKLESKVDEMILVLSSFKDPAMVDFFYERLKEEKTILTYKIYIIRYYAAIESLSDEIKEFLLKIVTDEKAETDLRSTAVYALGKLKYEPAKKVFNRELDKIEALEDIDEKKKFFKYRFRLLAALTHMGDASVVDTLIEMTKSNDPSTRRQAIEYLGDLGDKKYIELIEYKMKNDPSKGVKSAAEKALKKLRGESDKTKDQLP